MSIPHFNAAKALCHEIDRYQTERPDLHSYALIYGVAFPRAYRELQPGAGGSAAQSPSLIFGAVGDDKREQYGPFLLNLAQPLPPATRLMIAQRCYSDPRGVSFLFSRQTLPALTLALQARLEVKCEDRTQWQMKFFDSRTLPVLDRVLTVDQQRDYLGIIAQWWYLDREGALQKISGTDAPTDDYHGPLALTEAQTTTFIDAGLADSVLYTLGQTDDDLLAVFDPRTRYRIVAGSLEGATEAERNSALLLADRGRCALLEALRLRGDMRL